MLTHVLSSSAMPLVGLREPIGAETQGAGAAIVDLARCERAQGDTADPSVERRFQFSGTTLTSAKAGERSATLSGGTTMPAQ